MSSIPNLPAIRDWCLSKFQPLGNYASVNDIPTQTSQLVNDSGFVTNAVDNLVNYYKKADTYTKNEIAALIANVSTISFEVVESLPTENISTSKIYLVPIENASSGNSYTEYVYINGQWEIIGQTDINLSGYVTTEQLNAALSDYLTSVPVAKISAIGGVKPDGTTITIDEDGTIHAVSSLELAESVLGGES